MSIPYASWRRIEKGIPSKTGVIIVGGGIAGLSTAWGFAREGYNDVIVLEKEFVGYGSSIRNAGRFRVHFFSPENTLFAIESRKRILEMNKWSDFNPLVATTGYLWLLYSEETVKAFREYNKSIWLPLGCPVEFLDLSEIKHKCPYLNTDNVVLGVFGPQNGVFHPDYMIMALASYVSRHGIQVREYINVSRLLVENNKIKGVYVEGLGPIYSEKVVVAAGAWSGELLKTIGIEIPAEPTRKSLLVTEPYKYSIKPLIIPFEYKAYIGQTFKGEILASRGGYKSEPRDISIGKVSLKWLVETARVVVSVLKTGEKLRIMRIWSGTYYVTPDHSHLLGRDPEWPEGLYVNTGYSGHGMMLGLYAGELLAKLMLYDKEHEHLKPFKPTRFKEGKTIHERLVIG